MIIDALANMDFYKNLNESLYKGLKFLKRNGFGSFTCRTLRNRW